MIKYYTPEIEEFHIGFEYEYEDINEGGASTSWYKGILQPNEGYIIDQIYNDENREYRVKYLDREDIESLNIPSYIKVNHILNNTYEIIGTNARIFRGDIKNKSELKRLLKQLNINE